MVDEMENEQRISIRVPKVLLKEIELVVAKQPETYRDNVSLYVRSAIIRDMRRLKKEGFFND